MLFLDMNEKVYIITMIFFALMSDCKLIALVIYNLLQRLCLINHEPIRKTKKGYTLIFY